MSIEITHGSAADIADVVALRDALRWSQAGWLLEAALDTSALLLCARESGELVGCGAAVLYDDLGFIGTMIIAERLQGQGIGGRIFAGLMGWLTASGATRIELESTEAGRPLYEKHGFVERWLIPAGQLRRSPPPGEPPATIAAPAAADWAEIAALDRRAVGASREPFLRRLAAAPEADALVLRNDGRVAAFGMRFPDRIGPLLACSEPEAEALARALLAGVPAGLGVALANGGAVPFWERLGFELSPGDTRMAWGATPRDEPALIYAMVSGVIG